MKIYMIEQTYFDGAEFWKNPEAHYDSIEKAREHIRSSSCWQLRI